VSATLITAVNDADHVRGAVDAPLTLVEYGDFECPYCGMAYPIVKQVERELGDELRVVFRHFPLRQQHPHAVHAAQAAEAAAEHGRFWEMHDVIFEHQGALEDDDLVGYARGIGIDAADLGRALAEERYANVVRAHFRDGVKSGVNGTPTFFVNGSRFDGDWRSPAELIAALRATHLASR
jgi:protein-disulfide isomerase